MFPSPVVPQTYITQSLCSPVLMFSIFPSPSVSSPYVPQSLCSPVHLLPSPYRCSQVPMLPSPHVPPTNSPVPMFPSAHVPQTCSPILMFPELAHQSLYSQSYSTEVFSIPLCSSNMFPSPHVPQCLCFPNMFPSLYVPRTSTVMMLKIWEFLIGYYGFRFSSVTW